MIIIIIIIIITKTDNSLGATKQNLCIYKDTIYAYTCICVIMFNVT
jgi:hypothetical protein